MSITDVAFVIESFGTDCETPSLDTSLRANKLTPRETEVVRAIAKGFSSREIAAQLNISKSMVDCHRARIGRKIGVQGTAKVVLYAFSAGLVDAHGENKSSGASHS